MLTRLGWASNCATTNLTSIFMSLRPAFRFPYSTLRRGLITTRSHPLHSSRFVSSKASSLIASLPEASHHVCALDAPPSSPLSKEATLYVTEEIAQALGWTPEAGQAEGVKLTLHGWKPGYFAITKTGSESGELHQRMLEAAPTSEV